MLDAFCFQSLAPIRVAIRDILSILLHAWVHLLQTHCLCCGAPVLAGVGRGSRVASHFVAEELGADAHVGVVTTSSYDLTSRANLCDGIWSDL